MKNKIGLLILLLTTQLSFSQKHSSLEECEAQFLKTNLVLLASHYGIDQAKALTIQAKIWENPVFTADLNLYNPEIDKYFDNGTEGAKSFGISQIIYLGGKKANQVKLAKTNEQLAELEFNDLLRNLKFKLRQSFYTVYYNTLNIEVTDVQILQLEDLIKSYSKQVEKGNIPLKDLVRLQSLYLSFKNARMEVVNNNIEQQETLKLLLNQNQPVVPVVEKSNHLKYIKDLKFDIKALLQEASTNRPDYLLQKKTIEANELNVKLQRSLAIPDVVLGFSYTQRGGAFGNQKNINLAIPLPLWNVNKGNIQLSKLNLEQSKVNLQNSDLQLESEITANWNKWDVSRRNLNQISSTVNDNFDVVYKGVLSNFQKSNIDILEFTDFMESYREATIQLNELKKKVSLSAEELNSTINKDLF